MTELCQYVRRIVAAAASLSVFFAAAHETRAFDDCTDGVCLVGDRVLLQVGRSTATLFQDSLAVVAALQKGIGDTAELTEEGYQSVAAECCAQEMIAFAKRALESDGMYVCDGGGLAGTAIWFDCKDDKQSFDNLVKTLRKGVTGDCPFLRRGPDCTPMKETCEKFPEATLPECRHGDKIASAPAPTADADGRDPLMVPTPAPVSQFTLAPAPIADTDGRDPLMVPTPAPVSQFTFAPAPTADTDGRDPLMVPTPAPVSQTLAPAPAATPAPWTCAALGENCFSRTGCCKKMACLAGKCVQSCDARYGSIAKKSCDDDFLEGTKRVCRKGLCQAEEPQCCKAEVYGSDKFTGWKAEFSPGKYSKRTYEKQGAIDDDASSIKVLGAEGDCRVAVYAGPSLTAQPTWAPKTISINLRVGDYDQAALAEKGVRNDEISSLWVISQEKNICSDDNDCPYGYHCKDCACYSDFNIGDNIEILKDASVDWDFGPPWGRKRQWEKGDRGSVITVAGDRFLFKLTRAASYNRQKQRLAFWQVYEEGFKKV